MSPSSAPNGWSHSQPDDVSPQGGSEHREERQLDGGGQHQANGTDANGVEREEESASMERLQDNYLTAYNKAMQAKHDLRCLDRMSRKLQADSSADSTASIDRRRQAVSEQYRKKREAVNEALGAIEDAEASNLEDLASDSVYFGPSKTDVFTLIYPPRLPLYAYDPAELLDPEVMTSFPHTARRWRFLNDELSMPSDVSRARTMVTNVLKSRQYHPDQCIVTFPVDAAHIRYVQIHFMLHWDYERSKNLKLVWNERVLELTCSAAHMSGRDTVIKINDILPPYAGADSQVMTEVFEELGNFMKIDTMWRLDHTVETKQGTEKVRGASVIAVAEFESTFDGGPAWKPNQIPGWIWTSNGIFQLHVLGRKPSCGICRQTELMAYYHTTEECKGRPCLSCIDGDHPEIYCPFRPKKCARTAELLDASLNL